MIRQKEALKQKEAIKQKEAGKTEETDTAGEKRMRLQTEPAEDDRAVPLAAEIPVMSAGTLAKIQTQPA